MHQVGPEIGDVPTFVTALGTIQGGAVQTLGSCPSGHTVAVENDNGGPADAVHSWITVAT